MNLQKPSEKSVLPCSGGKRRRILLAEDDYEMRSLLARCLCDANYEVIECSDGVDLMDHLAALQHPGRRVDIDLVVSDIRMPFLTGLEILQGMHEYIGYPPMVLITAFGDSETHARALQLKAAAIIDKPFEMNELLRRIEQILPAEPPSAA